MKCISYFNIYQFPHSNKITIMRLLTHGCGIFFLSLLLILLICGNGIAKNGKLYSEEFNKLFEENSFSEAYNLLNEEKVHDDPNVDFTKALLLGAGLTGDEDYLCKAVVLLEKAENAGAIYARSSLNYLYGGDWISIAALEGSRLAIFEKAMRIINIDESNPIVEMENRAGNRKRVETAIKLLMDAETLGYTRATSELLNLKIENKGMILKGEKSSGLFFSPRPIFCGIRKYDN